MNDYTTVGENCLTYLPFLLSSLLSSKLILSVNLQLLAAFKLYILTPYLVVMRLYFRHWARQRLGICMAHPHLNEIRFQISKEFFSTESNSKLSKFVGPHLEDNNINIPITNMYPKNFTSGWSDTCSSLLSDRWSRRSRFRFCLFLGLCLAIISLGRCPQRCYIGKKEEVRRVLTIYPSLLNHTTKWTIAEMWITI